MTTLAELAVKIRSKNAGPFWLTIDIFCSAQSDYEQACKIADNTRVAQALGVQPDEIKRYELPDLNVLKFSLPRPEIQGTSFDRDMHGASFAHVLGQLSTI